MSDAASALFVRLVESYVAKVCHRFGKMVDLQIAKHPGAIEPLNELKAQIELFSLVFAPGDANHPAGGVGSGAPRRIAFKLPEERQIERPRPLPVEEREAFRKPARPLPPKAPKREGAKCGEVGFRAGRTEQILDLLRRGVPPRKVAAEVGCTVGNVYMARKRYAEELKG